tara:strand:+ start:22 stop:264 length:243 start_codon:yes stop_codon:yes gene_type:complete
LSHVAPPTSNNTAKFHFFCAINADHAHLLNALDWELGSKGKKMNFAFALKLLEDMQKMSNRRWGYGKFPDKRQLNRIPAI